MALEIREPQQRIEPEYIRVMRLKELIWSVISIVILIILFVVNNVYNLYTWIPILLWIIAAIDFCYVIWSIGVAPVLLQRYWRYEIGAEFVQLQRGRLIRTNQLIPMAKVQYVSLEQGPFLRRFGLYNVEIGTMGSQHRIPGLRQEEAIDVRERILKLAQIKEVES